MNGKLLCGCLIIMIVSLGCGTSRKSYEERRNLMLLENYEHPRNKNAHKPQHHTKKFKKKTKKHLQIKKM